MTFGFFLAFKNLTKPVGPFYNKEEADKLAEATGEVYIEDAGRGYRRVVASPIPQEIVEKETIETLVKAGNIVIACGGGGIPVYQNDKTKGASVGDRCHLTTTSDGLFVVAHIHAQQGLSVEGSQHAIGDGIA